MAGLRSVARRQIAQCPLAGLRDENMAALTKDARFVWTEAPLRPSSRAFRPGQQKRWGASPATGLIAKLVPRGRCSLWIHGVSAGRKLPKSAIERSSRFALPSGGMPLQEALKGSRSGLEARRTGLRV